MVTCAHDGCKHPALSILDWAVIGLSPLSQDVPTSSPQGRIQPLFEVTRPVPFQHPPIVFAVDLIMKKETYVSSQRFWSKLRHLTPLNSWWLFNSCHMCVIYCNNYTVYTRHLSFRVSQEVCYYFNNVQNTVSQFKPQQVFNKQQENLLNQSIHQGDKACPILKFRKWGLTACTHHGRYDPADVDRVVSVQVVHSPVFLVLRTDLEQIQAGLQNTGLIL